MRDTRRITTLAVAALLGGLRMDVQAEVQIDFDVDPPTPAGSKTFPEEGYVEGGYTVTLAGGGGFLGNQWATAPGLRAMTGTSFVPWGSTPGSLTFTRSDGVANTFKAKRVAMGSTATNNAVVSFNITGHYSGGGSVTRTVVAPSPTPPVRTVIKLGSEFNNLTSLVISSNVMQPALDTVVLDDATGPSPGVINLDFNPSTAWPWWKAISAYPGGVYAENGYTLTQTVGTGGGILTQTYNPALLDIMTGPALVPWSAPNPHYAFTRDDGEPFKATRVAVGSYHATNSAIWSITGHDQDGGTVSIRVNCPVGVRTVLDIGPDFNNLTNLVFASAWQQPLLDTLQLEDATEPPTALVTFGVDPPTPPENYKLISAYTNGVYTEGGHTLTQTGGTGAIMNKAFSANLGAMAGPSLVAFSGGMTNSFKRTDGVMRRFRAKSMAMGSFSPSNATWTVTGHYGGGATVTTNVTAAFGGRSIIHFAPEFDNLVELVFSVPNPSTANQPILDLLELGDAPVPGNMVLVR